MGMGRLDGEKMRVGLKSGYACERSVLSGRGGR